MKPIDAGAGLYDAHNHLQDERFQGCQSELVEASLGVGIARMVVNGSSEEDWPWVLDLARRFPSVVPSFGYHPWYIAQRTPEWRDRLVEFLDLSGGCVGEIGLDRWREPSDPVAQEEVFTWQLRLAAERNLPVSLHCLKAWGALETVLRREPRPERGFLLHSYGGPVEMVPAFVKLGAYFSFPGYFLHERKQRQRETFLHVPEERLLIETDAPDQLPPDLVLDFRLPVAANGTVLNHPANLAAVYRGFAAFAKTPLELLTRRVADNFSRFFLAGRTTVAPFPDETNKTE